MKKAQWIQHARIFHMDEYECSACGYRTEKPSETAIGGGRRQLMRSQRQQYIKGISASMVKAMPALARPTDSKIPLISMVIKQT